MSLNEVIKIFDSELLLTNKDFLKIDDARNLLIEKGFNNSLEEMLESGQIKHFEKQKIYLSKNPSIDLLDEAIKLFPDKAILYELRAEARVNTFDPKFQGNRNYQGAIEDFEKVLSLDDENTFAHANIGDIYFKMLLFEKAILEYKKHIEKSGYNEIAEKVPVELRDIYLKIGKCHYNLQEFDKAISCFDKVISVSKELENELQEYAFHSVFPWDEYFGFHMRGLSFARNGLHNSAISDFNAAARVIEDYHRYWDDNSSDIRWDEDSRKLWRESKEQSNLSQSIMDQLKSI